MIGRIAKFFLAALLVLPHFSRGQEVDVQRSYLAAQKLLLAGDLEGARNSFERLSKSNPDIAEIHATLGAIDFQLGDYKVALEELIQAKRIKPSLPKLDGLIAMSQSELGRYDEALPELEKTFRTAEDLPVKRLSGLQLERAFTALRQDSQAVAVALELQKLFPDDAEVLYHNERIFGNFAYLTVEKLAAVAPTSVWRHRAQAEADESQSKWDDAISEYRLILKLESRHLGIHYRIGRCYRERARDMHHPADIKAAMDEFQAELKLDPDSANAAYEIGELYRTAGELLPSKTYFETALKLYPDFPEANLGLGTVLASLDEPAKALKYLKVAVKSDPTDEATWWRIAQVERTLGHRAEQQAALKTFKALHEKQPDGHVQPVRDVTQQVVDPNTSP
jgi:tetratricopeptide (TPR) repeat protein